MRRIALLAPLLLSGCGGSGFWAYEGHTISLPWHNPNRPDGNSETYEHIRHLKQPDPPPMLTEAGDVWPGPPRPIPTLRDLQKQQAAEFTGQTADGPAAEASGSPGLTPLPDLPKLPGYEITPPDPAKAPPDTAFPGGRVQTPSGLSMPATGGQDYHPHPSGNGSIVVPNGNGTSTVINPNGSVSTIPTPK